MKNILFICNTHFQVLIAVIMKITKFTEVNVDIIVTDQMNESLNLYKRLQPMNLFRKVYHVNIKNSVYELSKFERIKLEFAPSNYRRVIDIEFKFYDELFVYNTGVLAEIIHFNLKKINAELKVNLFDEGVSTYSKLYEYNLYGKTKISYLRKILKKLFKRKYIADVATDLYLLDPDLICWEFGGVLHKISKPDFRDKEVINIINRVFGFEKDKSFKSDYIFFEESFFADGIEIGDLKLVKELVDIVPKDKITIKIHPRNKKNRFSEIGLKTNNMTAIPWEVIALNLDLDEHSSSKKFITISSSAVLSSFLLFGKESKTMMLYEYVNNKNLNKEYFEYFGKFKNKYPKFLSTPKNKRELENIIKEWEKFNDGGKVAYEKINS